MRPRASLIVERIRQNSGFPIALSASDSNNQGEGNQGPRQRWRRARSDRQVALFEDRLHPDGYRRSSTPKAEPKGRPGASGSRRAAGGLIPTSDASAVVTAAAFCNFGAIVDSELGSTIDARAVVNTDDPAARCARPSRSFVQEKLLDSSSSDTDQIFDQARSISPTVALVEVIQPAARELVTGMAKPVLSIREILACLDGAPGSRDWLPGVRGPTSRTWVVLAEIGAADAAVHSTGGNQLRCLCHFARYTVCCRGDQSVLRENPMPRPKRADEQ
jgi:hypothetical protein